MAKSCITYHIVGGGIAGLACAWLLKNKNNNIRVVIYEAASQLGGRAYSYINHSWKIPLDNAIHAIIGANKFMSRFVHKDEWKTTHYFINPDSYSLNCSLSDNSDILWKTFCNTEASEIDRKVKYNILSKLFPFCRSKYKVWFSSQNLTPRIINMLASYADEIHLKSRLQKISSQFGVAAQLNFEKFQVDIGADDKVIIALDNPACCKILNTAPLQHNSIINIVYQTSQTVFLPKGASYIGITQGIADWIFADNNILTAVISDYRLKSKDLSELAISVWKEIDRIRGVNSAFMPPYKVTRFPSATISMDTKNNSLRPQNCLTEYPNVYIAGDWTMRDYPCCMETAVESAKRAVKAAMKSK